MKRISCKKFVLSLVAVVFCLIFHTTLLVHVQFLKQWKAGNEELKSTIDWFDWKKCNQIAAENLNLLQNRAEQVDCKQIFANNFTEICKWSQFHQPAWSDERMYNELADCQSWLSKRQYPNEANSESESEYPLAFSISVHGNVQQLERLLRLIYWPQNLYCIHVDKKSTEYTHRAVERLASCFPNVFIAESESVYWAGYGVLKAVLNCMNQTLLERPDHKWRYFVNLAGQDFPLKTNLELVNIFQIFNGSNDVELNYELQFSRYWFSHRTVSDAQGRAYTHMADFRKSKLPIPNGLKVYKGNLAASLSRSFVEFLFNNTVAKNFTEWLRDTDTADEHLWSTLNHNRIDRNGNLSPGGYPAHCHDSRQHKSWVSRFVRWRNDKLDCRGRYVRDVCILGTGDLHSIVDRPELFVNKFYSDYQTKAFECMEQWFLNKVTKNTVEDLNVDYYKSLDGVKFRTYYLNPVDKKDNGAINESRVFDGCPQYMVKDRIREKSDIPVPLRKYIKGSVVAQFKV